MSKKVGVYLTERSQEVITGLARDEGGPSTSGVINAVLERYRWVCKSTLPDLTTLEWETLLNVYTGCEMSSYSPPYRVASDMMDDRGEVDLAVLAETDPDYAELVRKVHAMTQAEQLAIIDFCQRFWSRDWSSYPDFDAIKRELAQ